MSYGIRAISEYLPARIESSDEVIRRHGFDEAFVHKKLGIHARHVAATEETTSDLAAGALGRLLEETGLEREEIDLLAVVTQTPDYMLPHVSALVHARLGLHHGVAAFDIGLGCSGYVYGLGIVLPLMAAQSMRSGVLITAETYSKLLSPSDRATAPLFGDGASATLIGRDALYTVGRATFGTDGARHRALIAKGSGTRPEPHKPLHMDGREIFNFMMTEVPKDIAACLAANRLTRGDIDLWVFHQASAYMLNALAQRLELPSDRVVVEMGDIGNTTASTIPIALRRRVLARLPRPRRVLISGFGVGLSWASTVLFLEGAGD